MLSEIMGTTTQTDEESHYKRTEQLLSSFNIRTLEDDQALYIYSNKLPVLLDIVPYYKNRKLLKLLKPKLF
jgi:hypothetical protein